MRIQHNIAALNSSRNLLRNNKEVSKNLEKLSSGYAINKAGDDAAGLAISEKMRSQITGINTAIKNAQDGISLVQTAEGALTEVHSMLNRMVELATQSANGVHENGVDRQAINEEFESLTDEIDRIAVGTKFNNRVLFNGKIGKGEQIKFDGKNDTNKFGVNMTFNFVETTLPIDVDFVMASLNAVEFGKNTAGNPTIKIRLVDDDKQEIQANTLITDTQIKEEINKALADPNALDNLILSSDEKAEFKRVVGQVQVIGSIVGPSHIVKDPADTTVQMRFESKTNGLQEINKEINLQVGDTSDKFNKVGISIRKMDAGALGVKMISVETEHQAGSALPAINNAISIVSKERGKFGALQNRLEHTINNLSVNAENMTAAESRIRDVDIAKVMMEYTKNNILAQSAQSMLAHANQEPQGVLQLLQ